MMYQKFLRNTCSHRVIHAYDGDTGEYERDFADANEMLSVWPAAEIVCIRTNKDGSVNVYC